MYLLFDKMICVHLKSTSSCRNLLEDRRHLGEAKDRKFNKVTRHSMLLMQLLTILLKIAFLTFLLYIDATVANKMLLLSSN